MAKVSGHWDCTVPTPMGDQSFTLSVKVVEGRFDGKVRAGIGTMKVDGTVDGDSLAWSMAVPKPMPLTLTCRATVSGDMLEGKVKAGIFGSYPITGRRVKAPPPAASPE